jgi:hydrogenase/urease accessory protein HupE
LRFPACSLLILLPQLVTAHDLLVTGVAVDLRSDGTVVTVHAHKLNLSGRDPAGDIASRLKLSVDGQPFEPADIRLTNDSVNDILIWTARSKVTGRVVAIDRPIFPDIPADRTVVNVVSAEAPVGTVMLESNSGRMYIGETTPGLVTRFLREGITHILEGTDHIAFLIAILLPVRRIRNIVQVVTAFTLAHSVTLTLAASGLANVSPRLIEPAIAVSIVIAAAENLYTTNHGMAIRTFYAFGFGLIHGFGFAGSLAESGLPPYGLWPAIAAFNGGVEIGQLMIVCVVTPALAALERNRPTFTSAVVRYASFFIIAIGLAWSIQRIAS